MPFRPAGILSVMTVAVVLAACSGTVSGTPFAAGQAPRAGSSDAAGSEASSGAGSDPVCSLFSADEVKALIGIAPDGLPGVLLDFKGRSCSWQDPEVEGNHSMSLELGDPGTAPGGVLPAPDPAIGDRYDMPGGMRRDILARLMFVCGGTRICRVGITGKGRDEDVKAEVGLVDTVRKKVGG